MGGHRSRCTMYARVHSNERLQPYRRQGNRSLRRRPLHFSVKHSKTALCRITKNKPMKILLYNPDNGVTRNFMPHLWMFLLQALTPSGHEVLMWDGNAQPMDEAGHVELLRGHQMLLGGIRG